MTQLITQPGAQTAADRPANREPVFVLGVARSGTTLLSLMLDSHSLLAIPYESHFMTRYYRQRERWGDLSQLENRRTLVASILQERYVARWDHRLTVEEVALENPRTLPECISAVMEAYARERGKAVWGDKSPSYITDIDDLYNLFPRARFIHLIRDGRDVASSLVRQWWGSNDFVNAMRSWRELVYWSRKLLRMIPPEQTFELRFEDLVENPEQKLREITTFLGWDYEPHMATAYAENSAEKVGERIRQHHEHIAKPPSAEQAMKWKNSLSPADQALAFEIAGELLVELGYPEGVTRHPFKRWRELTHRVKGAIAWRKGLKRPR